MLLYQAYSEKVSSPDIGEYETFGIAVFVSEGNSKKEIKRISDVSVNGEAVEYVSQLCTNEQLDVVHIFDVIEDLIYV